MNVLLLVGLALACSVSAPAQLLASNAAGVSMGHIHLTVRDIDANKGFFTILGGTPVSNGSLQLIEFPGRFSRASVGAVVQ